MIRKSPHCRKCNTPMKGHIRGQCRPMVWYNHSTNTSHGGKYGWEKTSSLNDDTEDAAAKIVSLKKTLDVDGEDSKLAVPKNSVIAEADEWKPLANKTWWEYYRNWQDNSLSVPFPTRMGMSSEQLGDIMENYSKYVIFYQ